MGKKSTPKAPKAPDPEQMIQAEAEANRVNTYSPYGASTFTQNADGTWNNNVTPNAMVQALIDRQLQMAGAAPSTFSSGGAPAGVQARLADKLGGMSQPEYQTTQWGAVDMPSPEQMRAEQPAPPVQPPRTPGKPQIQRPGAPSGSTSPSINIGQPGRKVMLR